MLLLLSEGVSPSPLGSWQLLCEEALQALDAFLFFGEGRRNLHSLFNSVFK